jgi:REP element-mobilizing transposase RayT
MSGLTSHYPQFFTATILDWKRLLQPNKYKDIIIDSLTFLVKEKRVAVYGFVIMPNHIHLIWQIQQGHQKGNIQRDFLKYTAQKIKQDLRINHPEVLKRFKVNASDRIYQIWERNPLSIDLCSEKVLLQKLNYIHQNPSKEKWKLSETEESYEYSSAQFYHSGKSRWSFLSHYMG